jgi:hypothetical protein
MVRNDGESLVKSRGSCDERVVLKGGLAPDDMGFSAQINKLNTKQLGNKLCPLGRCETVRRNYVTLRSLVCA